MDQPIDIPWSRRLNSWLRGFGVLGMVGWLLWCYSLDLPNAAQSDGTPIARSDVWAEIVDILLENVFPTPDPTLPSSLSGWQFLPQRLGLLAVAAFILTGAGACGLLILRVLRLRGAFERPLREVMAFALGLSGLSLLTLAGGWFGVLSRPVFGAVVLTAIGLEMFLSLRSRSVRGSAGSGASLPPWYQRRWDTTGLVCLLAAAPFVLAMLLGASLPSTDFDVKEYHLEGPKEYFLQGQVQFLPHNVYTSFPFLTEMLSLLAMVLCDDWQAGALAGKVVLMVFAPLSAVGLFAAGRRWFSPQVGWLCVLLYLSTPWVYRISIIAYAEGGLTFYLLATLLAVLWTIAPYEQPVERASHAARVTDHSGPRRVLLCGLLAGSAVACKYPGVLSVALPLGGCLLLAAWRRTGSLGFAAAESERPAPRPDRQRLRGVLVTAGLFTLGTLITFGPWMVKNIVETGNPVYPLLYGVFGGADWDAASHQKWQAGHPPTIVTLAERPAALVSNLGTRLVDVTARSDWQSPLLFAAAPLALLWRGRRRLVWALWVYVGWLFVSWWALTHQIDRFWVPMLPVVVLLAGAGWGWLLKPAHDRSGGLSGDRWINRMLGGVAVLLIAAGVLFNLAFITTRLCGYNAYLIDLDAARREVTTPSIALVQDQLPDEARVLFIGEAQVFDADFDYVYNTVFDESLFERWTSADVPGVPPAEQPLRPGEEIRQTFAEHGITHVFVNWSEVLRYRLTYGYTDYVTPERFHELVRNDVLAPVALEPSRTLRRWDSVEPDARRIVADWGDSLHWQVGSLEALQQYELFEVR